MLQISPCGWPAQTSCKEQTMHTHTWCQTIPNHWLLARSVFATIQDQESFCLSHFTRCPMLPDSPCIRWFSHECLLMYLLYQQLNFLLIFTVEFTKNVFVLLLPVAISLWCSSFCSSLVYHRFRSGTVCTTNPILWTHCMSVLAYYFLKHFTYLFSTACFPDSVRLFNGTERCSGRVEVYHSGQWGKVCNNNWRNEEAAVVCKELGCGSPKKSQESFNFGDSGLRGYTSRCSGNVSSIAQCSLQEYPGTCQGVSLSCSGKTQKTGIYCTGTQFN